MTVVPVLLAESVDRLQNNSVYSLCEASYGPAT